MQSSQPLRQKKSLGQVFLKTEWPVNMMVERILNQGIKQVLEIGPGAGILTKALLNQGLAVTAVEKDTRFALDLSEQFKSFEAIAGASLELVNSDILFYDWSQWRHLGIGPEAVVGNIPYNISTPILLTVLKLFAVRPSLTFLMLMTQKEFAERIAAKPGTKNYGSITVYTQLRATISLEFTVPKTAFQPVPKVDSAVMIIRPKVETLPLEVLETAEKITRAAFSQRRKKLKSSIAKFLEKQWKSGIEPSSCPVDINDRADHLSPEDYVALTYWVLGKGQSTKDNV